MHEPADLMAADHDSLCRLTSLLVSRREPLVVERMLADSPTVTAFEQAWEDGGALVAWRDGLIGLGATWQRILLVDAPLSPMRIGRQPAVSDRRPLAEV